MQSIIYPAVTTYFIAYEGDDVAYGVTMSNQTTTTGLANLETYTDRNSYLARLAEFGISE
jgi:hypothetical protein